MDRRSFLKGLLAAPIVAALVPLLPKSKLLVVPEVIAEAAAVPDIGLLYYLTGVSFTTSGTTALEFKVNDKVISTFGPHSGYSFWDWKAQPPIAVWKGDQLSLVAAGTTAPLPFNASWWEF